MSENAISEQEIANREHLAPGKTGDNIAAKRVASYIWNGSNWQRMSQPQTGGLVGVAYDAVQYTNTSTTVDTYTYYTGGLTGTLVATVTITYTDSTKVTPQSIVRT
jgi:hypothetical protein